MRWRLKSPASQLFTQPFDQAQIKENIKAPRRWPLWVEFTGEFPAQSASNADRESVSVIQGYTAYHMPMYGVIIGSCNGILSVRHQSII